MASTDRQRWARVRRALAWKHPGLPTTWTRVLDSHPEGAVAEPGYVWLETPGKVLYAAERQLEFTRIPWSGASACRLAPPLSRHPRSSHRPARLVTRNAEVGNPQSSHGATIEDFAGGGRVVPVTNALVTIALGCSVSPEPAGGPPRARAPAASARSPAAWRRSGS